MDLEAALAATLPSASMAEGVMEADEADEDVLEPSAEPGGEAAAASGEEAPARLH